MGERAYVDDSVDTYVLVYIHVYSCYLFFRFESLVRSRERRCRNKCRDLRKCSESFASWVGREGTSNISPNGKSR